MIEEIAYLLPSAIDIKYNHLDIDGLQVTTYAVLSYPLHIELFRVIDVLMQENAYVTFHIKRENSAEFIKHLTSIIAKSSAEIKTINNNQQDINVLDSIKDKAQRIRKKIQIDNEQIYTVTTYLLMANVNKKDLINKAKIYCDKLYSNHIVAKPLNFQQKEGYLSSLPFSNNDKHISTYSSNIFPESSLANLFPFFTRQVFFEEGCLIGRANGTICCMDILNENNINHNMCVFGSSGTGKSFFIKLHILRNAYRSVNQIIVDPEGEYVELVRYLGGQVYDTSNYNMFKIEEEFVADRKETFLSEKINLLIEMFKNIIDETKCNSEFENFLKSSFEKLYLEFGITSDINCLYSDSDGDKLFLKKKYRTQTMFPNIEDYIRSLDKEKYSSINIETLREKLNNAQKREAPDNNVMINNLYCFNVKSNTVQEMNNKMKLFFPKIKELIRENTIVYFDELWKCIAGEENLYSIEQIYTLFKTIRKRQAGVVAITQDVSDLFSYDSGNLGKSILNNSFMKVLFKMDYSDVDAIEKLVLNKGNLYKMVRTLERGNCYVGMGNTQFELKVDASKYEKGIIEGVRENEESIGGNK